MYQVSETQLFVKRLLQHEYDSARAEDERLASVHLLEENSRTVADLRKELDKVRIERNNLNEQVWQMRAVKEETSGLLNASERLVTQSVEATNMPLNMRSRADKSTRHDDLLSGSGSSVEHSSEDHDASKEEPRKLCTNRRVRSGPHPPGFKELCGRVEKFSSRTGNCDFELWLEDFEEASRL